MKNPHIIAIKALIIFLVVVFFLNGLFKWGDLFIQKAYYENASFLATMVVGALPLIGLYVVYLIIKYTIQFKP